MEVAAKHRVAEEWMSDRRAVSLSPSAVALPPVWPRFPSGTLTVRSPTFVASTGKTGRGSDAVLLGWIDRYFTAKEIKAAVGAAANKVLEIYGTPDCSPFVCPSPLRGRPSTAMAAPTQRSILVACCCSRTSSRWT